MGRRLLPASSPIPPYSSPMTSANPQQQGECYADALTPRPPQSWYDEGADPVESTPSAQR
jgi:hypothetical protein